MSNAHRILSLLILALSSSALAADKLPQRALARLGDYRFYHGPGINFAVLSPDGSRIATSAEYSSWQDYSEMERIAYQRTIVLWDAATGERLHELQVPSGPVQCLAFSPDGNRLVAGCWTPESETSLIVFDVGSGKHLREIGPLENSVSMDFLAGGKELRVSERYGPVTTWDVETGKRQRQWQPPRKAPDFIKEREHVLDGILSPDAKFIAWFYWEPPDYSNVPPGAVPPPPPPPRATILLVCDAATEKPIYRQDYEEGPLDTFTFLPDGQHFVTARDKFRVRETANGKERATLPDTEAYRFALSPDGKQAVIADSWGRVKVWDLDKKKLLHDLFPRHSSLDLRSSQLFSADGKMLIFATGATVRLFDMATGKEGNMVGHRSPPMPRFSTDGRKLITLCDEVQIQWGLSTEKEPKFVSREAGPPRRISGARWVLGHSADGRYFLNNSWSNVQMLESGSGRLVHQLANVGHVYVGLFSPDGSRVVLWHEPHDGSSDFLCFHDAKTGKVVGESATPNQVLRRLVYSPDGRYIAWADKANDVHLLDGATGKLIRTLTSTRPLPKTECTEAHFLFSADSEFLVVTTCIDHIFPWEKKDNVIHPSRLFQVGSGREVSRFYYNPMKEDKASLLSCEALSPDCRLLAVAEEDSASIRLIEILSGKVRAEFNGHRHGVHGLAFSPDGKTLASGGEDNVVYLWDVTGGKSGTVKKPSDADLAASWTNLAIDDAIKAGDAMSALIRAPGPSVAFLKESLPPAEALDEKRLARLIADLDADAFERREAATKGLAQLDDRAERALRIALKNKPSPEAKRRLDELLGKIENNSPAPETLRAVRAVETLEHIGTTEARKLLETLAGGAVEARQTREAKAVLERMRKETK